VKSKYSEEAKLTASDFGRRFSFFVLEILQNLK